MHHTAVPRESASPLNPSAHPANDAEAPPEARRPVPPLRGLERVEMVDGAPAHTLELRLEGRLMAWGYCHGADGAELLRGLARTWCKERGLRSRQWVRARRGRAGRLAVRRALEVQPMPQTSAPHWFLQ